MKRAKRIIILLTVLGIVPALINNNTLYSIWIMMLIYAALGEALTIMTGFAGQVSFGHAVFFGIGAYTSSVLFYRFGISPWMGMAAGAVLSAAFAAIIGYSCFRLRGPYFSVATLAVSEIIKQLFIGWDFVEGATGIALPITGDSLYYMEFHNSKLPYVYLALILFAVTISVCAIIESSRMGCYLKVIRESHSAAEAIGINPAKYKLYAIIVSSAMSALCGSLYAQYVLYIDPYMIFSMDVSIKILLLSVLGGSRSIFGPIVGAAVLIPLTELTAAYTGGLADGIDLLVFGVLIIVVSCCQPEGIIGARRQRNGRSAV